MWRFSFLGIVCGLECATDHDTCGTRMCAGLLVVSVETRNPKPRHETLNPETPFSTRLSGPPGSRSPKSRQQSWASYACGAGSLEGNLLVSARIQRYLQAHVCLQSFVLIGGLRVIIAIQRLHGSSFLGLPYRVLNMNPKKELLWSP